MFQPTTGRQLNMIEGGSKEYIEALIKQLEQGEWSEVSAIHLYINVSNLCINSDETFSYEKEEIRKDYDATKAALLIQLSTSH